jgi:sodium/proline symporter
LPEYFERRFNDPGHTLRYVTALCILVFFVFYTAAGFVAGGKLFATAFAVDYADAVTLGALLIVFYTAFGGFLAVAWTDAMQATLMFGALTLVAVLALTVSASAPGIVGATPPLTALSGITITSALAWGLGYCGQPHILARFMALRDPASAAPARRLATGWTGIALLAAIVVGISGHWVLDPAVLAPDPETVFIRLLDVLVHPAVAGICLAAILAAIMSTADSQLLVAAAALTHDLIPRRRGHPAPGIGWHRVAVCLVCAVAWQLALTAQAGVLTLVATAWAGFGASLGPAVIMSLYAPGTPRSGILAGICTGAGSVVVWEQFDGGIFDLYSLLPGFVCGLGVMLVYAVSSPRKLSGDGTERSI